jgi:hypothetical protein
VAIPDSVREWLLLETADPLREGFPLEIAHHGPGELGHPRSRAGEAERDLLQVMDDPGNCRWAVRLDGTSDPEVLEDGYEDYWRPTANPYSTFLFAYVWDSSFFRLGPWAHCWGRFRPSERDLDRLGRDYRAGPRATDPSGNVTHRFHGEGTRVFVVLGVEGGATWYVSGRSRTVLAAAVRALGPLTGLPRCPEGWDHYPSSPSRGHSPSGSGPASRIGLLPRGADSGPETGWEDGRG